MTEITRRHAALAIRLARRLREVPEGDGTMLDHTTIVFLSDNGERHHGTAEEWPIFLLGGADATEARSDDASEPFLLNAGSSNGIVGALDDVRVFDRVLSASEVRRVYESTP